MLPVKTADPILTLDVFRHLVVWPQLRRVPVAVVYLDGTVRLDAPMHQEKGLVRCLAILCILRYLMKDQIVLEEVVMLIILMLLELLLEVYDLPLRHEINHH